MEGSDDIGFTVACLLVALLSFLAVNMVALPCLLMPVFYLLGIDVNARSFLMAGKCFVMIRIAIWVIQGITYRE